MTNKIKMMLSMVNMILMILIHNEQKSRTIQVKQQIQRFLLKMLSLLSVTEVKSQIKIKLELVLPETHQAKPTCTRNKELAKPTSTRMTNSTHKTAFKKEFSSKVHHLKTV